jgi:HEAT repeat protein
VESTDARRPQGIESVKEVLQSLQKTKKNLRLYPSNNPMYAKMVDAAYDRVRDFLDSYGQLDMRFSRNDIFFREESAYHEEGKDDNLALFFFRDGLRSVILETDLDKKEFQQFLEIMSVDFDSEEVEDDMVTLLWEKDFSHIKYTVDDNVLVEDEDYEERATREAKDGAMEEDSIAHAYEDALAVEDLDVVPAMPITEQDLKALATEIQEDSAGNKMAKLADILFNMLYIADTTEAFRDVARILNNAVEFSVRHGNLRSAALIFSRTGDIMGKAKDEELRRSLSTVLVNSGSPALIKFIGEQLDAKEGIAEDEFNEYVKHLGANAIQPFMALLAELRTIGGRKNVINALAHLGGKDLPRILRGLQDERWYVVRNVIHVLRRIGDVRAVEPLIVVSGHPDARVRKEAVKSLGEFGGQNAAETVQFFLDDPDKAVQSTAVKALGAIGSEYTKVVLLQRMKEKRFLSTDLSEMREYFEVIARWREDDVFDFLMGVVKRNPFFGRAKYNDYKACAAYGLGLMGRPDALDELNKLKDSKHKTLSEYSLNAIKRISYARKA